jgi:hypothetical protein
MKRVFLGGTKGSKWRDELIPMLKIDYFNPIDDPDDEARASEAIERNTADFVLFVITPDMVGSIFAIAEAVHYSSRRPDKTIFCWFKEYGDAAFGDKEAKHIKDICDLIIDNGARFFFGLKQISEYLNSFFVEIPYHPDVVECLIERDGPTSITLSRNTYEFKKNDAGHSVCLVSLREHRNHLVKLPDFRIYMKDKLPKPDFTDEELDFIRQWKLRGPDQFMAFVNVKEHIERFNKSSDRMRAIAWKKWRALLPDVKCPINPPTGSVASVVDEWLRLNTVDFKDYVLKNLDRIANGPEGDIAKAKDKWERLVFRKTEEPWPINTE